VKPRVLKVEYKNFEEKRFLHILGRSGILMKAALSSETLVSIYKATRSHNLEDLNMKNHGSEKLNKFNFQFGMPAAIWMPTIVFQEWPRHSSGG
jgi:hypothetical protein